MFHPKHTSRQRQFFPTLFFTFLLFNINAQIYTPFEVVGVGGGGGMYEPSISPHDSDHIWLSCDMGGMYRTLDGGDSWELIHMDQLTSTTKSDIQFTSDPNIMYVISRSLEMINNQLNRGILSKSIDGGNTWFKVSEPTTAAGVHDALADPNDTERVLINDWKNLYFSNDGGTTWTNVYQPVAPNDMWLGGAFWDGNDIYVGTADGLLVSHDNGQNFQIESYPGMPAGQGFFRLQGAKENGQVRLVVLPAPSSSLFAHFFVDQLFGTIGDIYRLDYGPSATWENIQSNITYTEPVNDIALSCCDIDTIWISVSSSFPPNGTIWPLTMRSTDGGASWTQMMQYINNANLTTGWTGHDGPQGFAWNQNNFGIDVDPNDPNRAMVLCNYGHITSDGGSTWDAIYIDPTTRNPIAQPSSTVEYFTSSGLDVTAQNDIHFFEADRYLVGNTDIGNMYTEDGGLSWSFKRGVFFSWSSQNGPYAHPHWYNFEKDPSQNKIYTCVGLFGDPYHSSILDDNYDNLPGFILSTTDEGLNWDTVFALNHPILNVSLDPNAPNNLYASVMSFANGGIYHSSDAGLTWNPLSAPPRTEGHPNFVEVLDDGSIVANYSGRKVNFNLTPSSGVFYSTDGGQTWEDRSDAGMIYYTKEIIIDENDPTQNTWYASVVGRHDTWPPSDPASLGLGGVYKTTDRGLNWTRIFAEEYTQSMTINPLNPEEMYVPVKWDGIYKTTNLNSATPIFTRVDEYPHPRCRRVVFNPFRPEEMFVITRGGGLWKRTETTDTSADVVVDPECITLYPNPTPDAFTIEGTLIDFDISILDMLGNVYQMYAPTGNTFTINIQNLPAGLYFVQIKHKTNGQIFIEKILKQ